ncbi:elongin-A-like [Myotis yumanensis]|uniref:elongin-A-like n=1 Tax=Myotis yumanensis TaxID=159337 RepID=UPI0038D46A9C
MAAAAAAAAAEEEEFDPPSMSFEAYLTYDWPPSEKASENPVKRKNHKHSGTSQSDKAKQSLHGSDAGKGAGVLPPKVRQKVGRNLKTPEGKGKTPHLGRKPIGPSLEEEEEFQPPTMSFQEEDFTYDPRPSQVASGIPTLLWVAGAPWMSGAPSEVASENPLKKRKRKHSSQSQSDKDQQRLQGLGAGEGQGGLLPKVREKDGDTCKTPEGKVKTPHLGRKAAGPLPEMEQELDAPSMSSEAFHTHHQPPARKERKSVKAPATAPEGMSLRKEETTSAQAEMGKCEKRPPPAAAGARLPLVPPAGSPAWPDLGLCPGQLRDPPLPAFASTSSFQPRPRAPPSPSKEEGARLMGIRVHSRTPVFSGSKRAGRCKMTTMLQQCVQTPQNNVNLLSQLRGVPCSLLQHAVESDTPEEPPGLEEQHEAPAAETDPLWKQHQCHRALEKARREEHTAQLQPQEQEVPGLVLHLSANRPQGPPAKRAFSESSERGGAGPAVQEKAPPAPAPAAGTRAPSDPASRHSCHPIPGKRVVSGQKKPVKKMAPLMAKSIKDYKKWTYFLR